MPERNEGIIYGLKKKSIELGAWVQPKVLTGAILSIGGMFVGIPGAEIVAGYTSSWYALDKVQDEIVDRGGKIRAEVHAKRGEKPGIRHDFGRAIGNLRFWRWAPNRSLTRATA